VDIFYNKYYQSVRGFVAKRIDDEGLAEELTNDILMAAIKSLPNYDNKCSEFSWICSIAKHKIIDYYRKKKIKTVLFSVSEVFEDVADKALSPERESIEAELKGEIKKTLRELKAGYGSLLRLKYVDGMKIRQIAGILKLSVKAVESRLIRAKKQFRLAWNYDQKKS
jgi:RNA polymerase sigma-70 factor (ECF subfamily)